MTKSTRYFTMLKILADLPIYNQTLTDSSFDIAEVSFRVNEVLYENYKLDLEDV